MPTRITMGLVLTLLSLPALAAEPPGDIRELKLKDWKPRSSMVTKVSVVEKPLYPVIDIHNHLGGGKGVLTPERVKRYLAEMDAAGVKLVVNLDGGWGDKLKETVAALDQTHPGRFLTFALVNFDGIDEADWGQREAKRLEESFAAGARGLKFHKTLGLHHRYKDGKLMPVDDPKLEPVWEVCAKHNRPVIIHTADPAAFFTPLDQFNERWHELNEHPNWLFYGSQFPKREELLAQLHRVIEKHPKTTFINTHFGNNVEDLKAVAQKLDELPNMYVDFDARISELGRQPYAARRFFLKYQDRVLFGTDTTPRREAFRIYYRFLETDDEYFDCAASHHLQGFWMIYGIHLPREVLEKIYHHNAARLLGLPDAPAAVKSLRVKPTADFNVTGNGEHASWKNVEWQPLARRGGSLEYDANVKVQYSKTGIYVLFRGSDAKLTATLKDGGHLWTEDVFELFLQPDESQPTYFEYEISPLTSELALMVSHAGGKLLRWQPWMFDEGQVRKVRKAATFSGRSPKNGDASITNWGAEIFIPYALLDPLMKGAPKPGDRWRANFYRVDHDGGKTTAWDWSRVGKSFHDYRNFGVLVFE